jgi:hypothetical protein
MAEFTPLKASPFLRAARRLHANQRTATNAHVRTAADEAFAHFLRMAGDGQLETWLASHPEPDDDIDDSMAANPEEA